jgi:hypothetical protein
VPLRALPSPDRQDRDIRPRSSSAALVVALGSLALVALVSLLWSERPVKPVARLAPVVQIAAARLLLRPSDVLEGPPAAAPPIAPQIFATRHVTLVRRATETPTTMLPKQCKGPYMCGPKKHY